METDNSNNSGNERHLVAQPQPHDSGPESSDADGDVDDEACYDNWLKAFSNQWLHNQLTHQVSLAAGNSFWILAMKYIPKLMEMKENEGVTRKIPQFLQVILSFMAIYN